MSKLKNNFNLLIAIPLAILSVLNIILLYNNYTFHPKSVTVLSIINIILFAIFAKLSVKFKDNPTTFSKICGMLMPLITLAFNITSTMLIRTKSNTPITTIEPTITFVCSLVVFYNYSKHHLLDSIVSILVGLTSIPYLYFLFIALTFGSIGVNTVYQTEYSPNGTYCAEFIISDQGALGGDTYINVRHSAKDVPFITGTLQKRDKRIWFGNYGDNRYLIWKDDTTLTAENREKGDVYEYYIPDFVE